MKMKHLMNMKKYLLGIAVLFMAACSTSEDVDNLPVPDQEVEVIDVFGAEIDEETRAMLNEPSVTWEKGDEFLIWKSASTDHYKYTAESDGAYTRLVKNDAGVPRDQRARYYGIYGNVGEVEHVDGGVKITLPTEQEYRAGETFSRTAHVMMGMAEAAEQAQRTLQFHNITSLIKVQVATNSPDPIDVVKLSLSVTKGALTGEFLVIPDNENEFEMTSKNSDKPSKVTLTDIIGVSIAKNRPATFYIAVPIGTYSSPTLTITASNGKSYSLTNPNDFTVDRKKIVSLSQNPLPFDMNKPDAVQYAVGLWYPSGLADPVDGDLGVIFYLSEDGQSGSIIAGNVGENGDVLWSGFDPRYLAPTKQTPSYAIQTLPNAYRMGGLTWRLPSPNDYRVYGRTRDYGSWLPRFTQENFEYWTSLVGPSTSRYTAYTWTGEDFEGHTYNYETDLAYVNLMANFPAGAEIEYPEPEPEPEQPTYAVGQWYPSGNESYPGPGDYGFVYAVSEDGLSGDIMVGAMIKGNVLFDLPDYKVNRSEASSIASSYDKGDLSWSLLTLDQWAIINKLRKGTDIYTPTLSMMMENDTNFDYSNLYWSAESRRPSVAGPDILTTVRWVGENTRVNYTREEWSQYDPGLATVAYVCLTAHFGDAILKPEPDSNLRRYKVGDTYPHGSFIPTSDFGVVYEVSEDGLSGKIITGYPLAQVAGTYNRNDALHMAASYDVGGLVWNIPTLDEWESYSVERPNTSGSVLSSFTTDHYQYWTGNILHGMIGLTDIYPTVLWSSIDDIMQQENNKHTSSAPGIAYMCLTADFTNTEYK